MVMPNLEGMLVKFMGRKIPEAARLKARMDAEDREMEKRGQKPLTRRQALGKYSKYLGKRVSVK